MHTPHSLTSRIDGAAGPSHWHDRAQSFSPVPGEMVIEVDGRGNTVDVAVDSLS